MAPGVDVRVDAERDAHGRPQRPGARRDAIELAGRFRVDRLQAERHGPIELVAALADAAEDDLLGNEPGAQRHLDLAARVRVHLRPELTQQPHERRASNWLSAHSGWRAG